MAQATAAEVRLIEAVKARPPLWNKADEKYLDQGLKPKLWAKVAHEAQFPTPASADKEAAKARWTSLRDRFFKLKKQSRDKKVTGSAADDEQVDVKWPFYSSLTFLDDAAKPRQSYRLSLDPVVQKECVKDSVSEEPEEDSLSQKDPFETMQSFDDDELSVKTGGSRFGISRMLLTSSSTTSSTCRHSSSALFTGFKMSYFSYTDLGTLLKCIYSGFKCITLPIKVPFDFN